MSHDFMDAYRALNSLNSHSRDDVIDVFRKATSARIAVGKAGTRPLTASLMRFRVDHAAARDAISDTIPEALLREWNSVNIQTRVTSDEEFLRRPDLGRRIRDEDWERVLIPEFQAQPLLLLIGDGLSATAIQHNLGDILPSLRVSLQRYGLTMPRPIFLRYARVGAMDDLGERLNPETVIYLIGERPGLQTGNGMSSYLCYKPTLATIESDREVISNIHHEGLSPLEAGAMIADRIAVFREKQASGVPLKEKD